jgi:hypothetical protein
VRKENKKEERKIIVINIFSRGLQENIYLCIGLLSTVNG